MDIDNEDDEDPTVARALIPASRAVAIMFLLFENMRFYCNILLKDMHRRLVKCERKAVQAKQIAPKNVKVAAD